MKNLAVCSSLAANTKPKIVTLRIKACWHILFCIINAVPDLRDVKSFIVLYDNYDIVNELELLYLKLSVERTLSQKHSSGKPRMKAL